MTDAPIVPSTIRNPAISRSVTVSPPNQTDDLDVAFGAIRDAVAKGDQGAAKQAWIDLAILLGVAAQDTQHPSA